MNKLRCALLVLAVGAMGVAGCGDEDEEPTTAAGSEIISIDEIELEATEFESGEELAAAADDFCEQTFVVSQRYPAFGRTNPGIAAETEANARFALERAERLSELEPPSEVEDEWQEFIDASQAAGEQLEQISADAEAGKDVTDAFTELDGLIGKREEAAKGLGLEVCGISAASAAEPEDTGTGPAEDLEYPEPSNTIDEAAEEWQAAVSSPDCIEQTEELLHDQTGDFGSVGCETDGQFYSEAEIVATEQYGPVGMATYDAGPEFFTYDAEFVLDSDGALRFVGVNLVDGSSLRPANEGNDADDTAAAVVEAIRENDPDAFNDLLPIDVASDDPGGFAVDGPFDAFGSDETYGPQIVSDIREDAEASPQPLGINQSSAFYLLEANGNHFVLTMRHEPGSDLDYQFAAYWALDVDEGTAG